MVNRKYLIVVLLVIAAVFSLIGLKDVCKKEAQKPKAAIVAVDEPKQNTPPSMSGDEKKGFRIEDLSANPVFARQVKTEKEK